MIYVKRFFFLVSGIKIQNEQIPSGVYSALERANVTDSVLKSFNDVNLRWIAKENWKYSLNFDGMHISQILLLFEIFYSNYVRKNH